MVSLTFWLVGLAVDGPTSLKLIGCGGVPVNAVTLIIRQDVKGCVRGQASGLSSRSTLSPAGELTPEAWPVTPLSNASGARSQVSVRFPDRSGG